MTRKSVAGGGHAISSPVLLVVAALILAFLSVQVAVAGQGDGKKASHGKKHAKASKQQLRELRQELQALRGQVAVPQGQSGASATPTGAAGGDLTGTYPNPQIAPGVITAADVNPLNVDGAVGTPSVRSLGSGAGEALAGNATAGGDLGGSFSNLQIAAGVVHASELTSTVLRSDDYLALDNAITTETLACDSGERLLSGGVNVGAQVGESDVRITESAPSGNDDWTASIANDSGATGPRIFVIRILCLSA